MIRRYLAATVLALVLTACGGGEESFPEQGIVGAGAQLTPDFWIARLDEPDAILLDNTAIEAQNAKLLQVDSSMYDLQALPESLPRDRVAGWIADLADRPSEPLYGIDGETLSGETLEALADNRNLAAIPEQQPTRYGLVVQRADLRTFPTALRVFRSSGDTNIDRFQETALFPGTPVVIVHESLDGRWWFVVSPRYAAWIDKRQVAEGTAAEVFGYAEREPYRIVTGATVDTVFNPEVELLSQLQLDMGVRVPVLADWPADQPVNGQHADSAHVIELPLRAADGTLLLAPALLQQNRDSAGDYLPLTRANIIRQGFKFLGERYGWGHSYNGRDCSGFISEVYRSMGARMPRNTSAQSVSPALHKQLFGDADSREARMEAVRSLEVGDFVYIPGHVMMVIGHLDGEPWVIHDTTGASYLTPDGEMRRVRLNAVSVTPLLPLRISETESYIDRMSSIVRIASNPVHQATADL